MPTKPLLARKKTQTPPPPIPATPYVAGLKALNTQNWDQAIKELEILTKTNPIFIDGYALLAHAVLGKSQGQDMARATDIMLNALRINGGGLQTSLQVLEEFHQFFEILDSYDPGFSKSARPLQELLNAYVDLAQSLGGRPIQFSNGAKTCYDALHQILGEVSENFSVADEDRPRSIVQSIDQYILAQMPQFANEVHPSGASAIAHSGGFFEFVREQVADPVSHAIYLEFERLLQTEYYHCRDEGRPFVLAEAMKKLQVPVDLQWSERDADGRVTTRNGSFEGWEPQK